MNKVKTPYEQALLDLCKKAKVKSPLGLIDKKIAFNFYCDGDDIKVFGKISRVVIYNHDNQKKGFTVIFLNSGQDPNDELFMLMFIDNEWEYSYVVESETKESYLASDMFFETKWWQF